MDEDEKAGTDVWTRSGQVNSPAPQMGARGELQLAGAALLGAVANVVSMVGGKLATYLDAELEEAAAERSERAAVRRRAQGLG